MESVPLMEADDFKDDQQSVQPPPYERPAQLQPVPQERGFVYAPLSASQSNSNNTVVVANQPSLLPPVNIRQKSFKPSKKTLILSLVLLTVCSLLCNFPALFCLIPGVIFAVVGFNFSHSRDKKQSAGGFNGVSLCCSVTAIVSFIVTVVCLILYYGLSIGLRYSSYHDHYQPCGCYRDCSYSGGYSTSDYGYNPSDYGYSPSDYGYGYTTAGYECPVICC